MTIPYFYPMILYLSSEKKKWKCKQQVGGFNPFEKYDRQIGSFPQGFGVKIKNIWVATT